MSTFIADRGISKSSRSPTVCVVKKPDRVTAPRVTTALYDRILVLPLTLCPESLPGVDNVVTGRAVDSLLTAAGATTGRSDA